MKIIDINFDGRINGVCVTATCSYEWYVAATTSSELNLKIQRGIIKDSKAYRTLRADLLRGCILPPLVLAISEFDWPVALNQVKSDFAVLTSNDVATAEQRLSDISAYSIYIIDGLQRTNAIRQTLEGLRDSAQQKAEFLARKLRVEIWVNIPFTAVAYRMLLLNAGQKPMSIKHQVEILSMKLGEDLSAIPDIEILTSLNAQRRTKPGQFTLAKLAQALQAWLQGSPNIDVRNTVMEQLLAESAIETLGTSLSGAQAHDDFKSLVSWFVAMDQLVFASNSEFFGNETVLLGIAAAVGAAQRNDQLRERMKKCLIVLLQATAAGATNALAIERFEELRHGEDVRKVNVGQFTREMIYRAFQEFFVSNGEKPMEDCWAFGASQK